MPNSDRPPSPLAGMVDFVRPAIRALSPGEVEQKLAAHRLYLQTERRQGRRANFSSTDLSGLDFSGLDLRRIKMDRALLRDADFTRAQLEKANMIGAIILHAHFDGADLSDANLSGTVGLTQAQLARAHCNSTTKLPNGLIGRPHAKE